MVKFWDFGDAQVNKFLSVFMEEKMEGWDND
jgi:hypothetical protein